MYIAPLVEDYGWPFHSVHSSVFGTQWDNFFDHHSLKDIADLRWTRQKTPFSSARFHPDSENRIRWIIGAHVFGRRTPCAALKNGKARFLAFRKLTAKTGRLPAPAILMEDWLGFRILDGNHRISALASLPNSNALTLDYWLGKSN